MRPIRPPSGQFKAVPGESSESTASESRLLSRSSGMRAAARSVDSPVRIILGAPPTESSVVSIRSRPHDDVLEYTHAFVVAYVRRRFLSRVVEPLSVATYELLGNALGYGSVSQEVVLQLFESPTGISVSVTNDTVQTRIEMLTTQLERLSRNPEATFIEEMRRSVGGGVGRPVLGLARIVHESKLSLDVYISGLRVTAIARAPA